MLRAQHQCEIPLENWDISVGHHPPPWLQQKLGASCSSKTCPPVLYSHHKPSITHLSSPNFTKTRNPCKYLNWPWWRRIWDQAFREVPRVCVCYNQVVWVSYNCTVSHLDPSTPQASPWLPCSITEKTHMSWVTLRVHLRDGSLVDLWVRIPLPRALFTHI